MVDTSLSKNRVRSIFKRPGCKVPSAVNLPKKSTLEAGRRTTQNLLFPLMGPSAMRMGALFLSSFFRTVTNSSLLIVAVNRRIGDPFLKWTLTPKMSVSKAGLNSAQWPSKP